MSSVVTAGRSARWLFSLPTLGGRAIAARRGYARPLRLRQTARPQSPSPLVQKPKPVGALDASAAPPKLLFSPADVPIVSMWQEALYFLDNQDLTAEQCHEAAHSYVSVATQYESQWRDTLESRFSLSPYVLHWLGIIILSSKLDASFRLGTHLLRSASELGYAPSTLTLVRIFQGERNRPHFSRILETTTYRSAEARFKALVDAGQDPNALSLQGIIFMGDKEHDRAVTYFQKARKAWASSQDPSAQSLATSPELRVDFSEDGDSIFPSPREPRWEWEVSCLLGEADIRAERGQLQQAEQLYREAALGLDNPYAFTRLATLTQGPERQAYLLKAAVSGDVDACRELAAVEELNAQESATEREKEFRLQMSQEWLRLANGEELQTVGSNAEAEADSQGAA